MSNVIPDALALVVVADDAEIVASDHRNNYAAIQTAVNDLIAALSGGTSGETLQAVDSTHVQYGAGGQKLAWVGMPVGDSPSASVAWPAANAAILVPFTLQTQQTIASVSVVAGATQSGHFDIGVYDSAGTLKVSKGSTLQSTLSASTVNTVTFAATVLPAGLYYLAVAADNTTGTFKFDAAATLLAGLQLQVAAAFPLPATITPGSTAPSRALLAVAPLT